MDSMITLLLEYKWWLLLIFETTAWLATIYMIFARYWLSSNLQFYLSSAVALITGYVPHITLAIMDYQQTGTLNLFPIFIIILLVLGFVFGKVYINRLDRLIKSWAVNKKKNLSKDRTSLEQT